VADAFPAGRGSALRCLLVAFDVRADPLGRVFFVRNELDRFAIGDRSPGLRRNADGSLDIWIGADNPGPDRGANWLPAPPGPFHLFPCAYLPRIDQLEGRMPVPHPGTYDD